MNEKMVDLETRLMELERQHQELSDLVADQWKIIDALRGSLSQHKDRIGVLEAAQGAKKSEAASSIDEARENIPPHY